MKFGPVLLDEAEGAISAHALRLPSGTVKKGAVLLAAHIEAMRAAGLTEVVAARLEPGDLDEDAAALAVAQMLRGDNVRLDPPFTGRCNLHAEVAGLLVVDRDAVDALNRLDPELTIATLPAFAPVQAGRMVATVKIIPFALPRCVIAAAARLGGKPALTVARWKPLKIGLVASVLPSLKPATMDKTRRVLDERLKRAGAFVASELRVPHRIDEVASAMRDSRAGGAELVIAFGASAITDTQDVIPAALRKAGGRVHHLGMPVDPGNLLLLGELDGAPVLGAPGCARSPVENGFDWILNRLLAGLPVTREDITGLGVGGLLMEIVSRPQPREPQAEGPPSVAAVILAAGRSSRMGGPNKLLARFDGEPLIRRVAKEALGSEAGTVTVVTGDREAAVRAALEGMPVAFAHNSDFADGLATSLKAGLSQVPDTAGGALVMLADMPGVTAAIINRLIETFRRSHAKAIVLPTCAGKRGNPVLWPRRLFAELQTVSGDTGARHLLGLHDDAVERVELGPAVMLDVDTPDALAAAGGIID